MRVATKVQGIVLFFTLLFSQAVSAGWRVDGNSWRTDYNDSTRLALVQGFVEAHSYVAVVAPLYVCMAVSKANDCTSVGADRLNTSLSDFSGLTYGQLRDGVNSFYADYRNRKIELPGAMNYVVRAIRGASAPELETYAEGMRKFAPK